MIDREADEAQKGRPGRIVAKKNALVDAEAIRALYRASQAGVKIELPVPATPDLAMATLAPHEAFALDLLPRWPIASDTPPA